MKSVLVLLIWTAVSFFLILFARDVFIYDTVELVLPAAHEVRSIEARLGNLGTWLQATISLLTLIITSFAIIQLFMVRQQIANDEIRKQQDAYRRLVDPQMVSIKRFIHSEHVGNCFDVLEEYLSNTELTQKDATTKLGELRADMRVDKPDDDYPLFQGKALTLDHIELVLNEYNSLSKLLNEGKLDSQFSTELGLKNFNTIYQKTLPFIKLRQNMNPSYAKEFESFCLSKRKTNSRGYHVSSFLKYLISAFPYRNSSKK
ncbi:hypothetical protein [Cohaesibacter gelatinilyticus]|uniref:Uncharacterized protein n=1 Tax=Cohaesibacter gelatinilyticus TaxID=372072 RepID=A0A285PC25_9HYPH|nr:hypothetical protein [Cohaesibacter gelatinilyticus]SNZ19282.1 hypothetical protein SAMN06265368_2363 [Cohaesibacter gelatinilyticus]